MKKRKRSRDIDIPTSSMADIAFLLLVFFLLVTTIDVDTGLYMELPPPLDQPPPEIPERNMLAILVSAQGDVLVDREFVTVGDIRPLVKRFVTNYGRVPSLSDSPQEAIVSFKTERRARYDMYIRVLDEIKMSYIELRNEYSMQNFGVDYPTFRARLAPGAEDPVRAEFPQRISLAEPDPGE